jgi:hypothetical protein
VIVTNMFSATPEDYKLSGQLAKHRVSDNVGSVKQYLRTLHLALGEERHFALGDGLPFPTQARL